MATIVNQTGNFLGGPGRLITATQDVSTTGTPLTTVAQTFIAALLDAGIKQRALTVAWTGDQTLDLIIQMDLGAGGNGLQAIADLHFVAGNVTAQIATFYPSINTGAAAGTSLVSGTQPTFAAGPNAAAVTTWEFLKAIANRIQIQAKAGGTTTVGTLTIDLAESD